MNTNPLDKSDREPEHGEIPAAESWHAIPGATGHQMPEVPPDDEDAEGQSVSAQLVEKGVDKAEEEQMRRAAEEEKEAAKRARREP